MLDLIKAALKTGSGTISTLLFGILSTKVMAVMLGPSGIGLLSLLRQVRQTAVAVATVSGNTALVQGISVREATERKHYIKTVLFLMTLFSCLVSFSLFLGADHVSGWIFGLDGNKFVALIRWLALPVLLSSLVVFFSGVLNGFRAIGRLAIVNVVGSFTILVISYPVAYFFKDGYEMAFIWMMTASSISALITAIFFLRGQGLIDLFFSDFLSSLNRKDANHFLTISMAMLAGGVANTVVILLIRSMVTHDSGIEGAGIFDVAWTLSMMYVGLITQSFGTYYLPTLSKCNSAAERIILIQRVFHLATLVLVPVVVSVVVLKPTLLHLLYSDEFYPSLSLIRWMLIGDYFKVTSWIFGTLILAYADMRTFLWTELPSLLFLFLSAYFSISLFENIEGIGIGFLLLYILHLTFMSYYAISKYKYIFTVTSVIHWFIGLLLIIIFSFITWNSVNISFFISVLGIILSIILSFLFLTKGEKNRCFDYIFSKIVRR